MTKQEPPPAEPVASDEHPDHWWCPRCNDWVHGAQVTHEYYHGACGCYVGGEVQELKAALDSEKARADAAEAKCIQLKEQAFPLAEFPMRCTNCAALESQLAAERERSERRRTILLRLQCYFPEDEAIAAEVADDLQAAGEEKETGGGA